MSNIIYSKLTDKEFNRYIEKNILANEKDYIQYRTEQFMYRTLSIVLYCVYFVIVTRFSPYLYHYIQKVGESMALHSVTATVFATSLTGGFILLGIFLCKKLLNVLKIVFLPFYTYTDLKKNFCYYVEANYFPLFKLQDLIRRGIIKRLDVKRDLSVIDVKYEIKGETLSKEIFVTRECLAIFQTDLMDFSVLDDIIEQRVSELEMPAILS